MSISSKELVDSLIVGNFTNFSQHTMRLLQVIESGQEVMLNDVALNDPDQLSVAIFNYPIIKDDLYREFAEAAKRISHAKYAYYKKSATFKENFTKLCTETFNKHHQADFSLTHLEQIQKVRSALKVIKFIGELYLADFFINCNIAHFMEVLSKNIDSKVSEDCLQCLILIVSNRVRNEVKIYKHNVHTAAIVNIIAEYENETSKLKRNYKDLEIIEAVNKTIKNKSLKGSNMKDASRSETVKQTRKIFETILSGNLQLSSCVQKAYDVSIIFPDSFENEMLQLCADYIKKSFEASDDLGLKEKCLVIVKFIGMLYNIEALTSDGVKGTISFLNKLDSAFSEPLVNVILNEIYEKFIELEDEVLKQVIPNDFKKMSNGHSVEKEPNQIESSNGKEEDYQIPSTSSASSSTPDLTPQSRSSISESLQNAAVPITNNFCEPVDKFKDLLIKLSPTNIAYILRETSQIRFTNGEDTIKELAVILVEHAVNKPALIKTITQVAVKLPDTIVPHFNGSLMRKQLKFTISSKISGCCEKEAVAYGQFIKELQAANYYDRFDIIILLDNFTDNFNYDRTALNSLLQFIEEFKDILISKKLSKNMKQKLINISQKLSIKMSEESDEEVKEKISNAIKILNSEVKIQSEKPNSPKKEYNYKTNEDVPHKHETLINTIGNSTPPPIILPPMHIPPPKMFIPPPNFINNQFSSNESSTNASPIHASSSKNVLLGKDKQLMNFKSTDDTKSCDDFSNRQSGSPSSASVSMQGNDIESDEFYDTASNAESLLYDSKIDIENESAYSSLLEERIKEDQFQNIIRDQFIVNSETIEMFVVTFINRGMKSQNSGYIKLIDDIQEGLVENKELFGRFIIILERKFLEFIQNLPNAEEEISKKEKRKSLQLILMTGEFYNLGYMKDPIFISCLEKLLNDIGSEHQITLFHQLIKISLDKIIENGIADVCKTFLDVLAKRIQTIIDSNDRNLIAWELFVTMKVLLFRLKKAQLECPVTYFKIFLSNMNEENFMPKLEDLKFRYSFKKDQIVEVVEYFLQTAISSFKSPIFVKSADELQEIRAIDDPNFLFKTHMEFKLHDVIKNFLMDIQNDFKMIELYKITSFVGDLFAGNVASIYLVLCILEMLLEKEIESKKIVDCIKVLLQKVGFKIDQESVLILDKFFLFFKQVAKNDKGYRKIIYKDLIELREKNWNRMENERNLEVIEELFGKLTHLNFVQISFFISAILSKSFELLELFIKLLWKFILINPESILLYAKLSFSISNYISGFKESFLSFMMQRNETFKIICQEPKIPDDTKSKLASVILFMGYLYAFDFCGDDDIVQWMIPSFTKQLTIEQCDKLNSIIGNKINESQNNELLRAFMALIEYHSRENLFAAIKTNGFFTKEDYP